jgi:uncharacterized protein YggE
VKTISILAVAAAIGAAAAVAVARPSSAHGGPTVSGRMVTVVGTATTRAVPNTALFTFGLETEAATANAALADNGGRMRRVIAALLRTGVAKDDIQTQDVSVYPRQNDNGEVVGYSANGSVAATVRRLVRAGAVVDAAVGAGATETSGPQFSRSGTELTREALREAFSNARAKAETLAGEAGATLGEVRRIEENAQAPEPVPLYRAALDAGTPIEPGTQQSQATVTVTFSLS